MKTHICMWLIIYLSKIKTVQFYYLNRNISFETRFLSSKLYIYMDNILLHGRVSEILVLGPSFHFLSKAGNFWDLFEEKFFFHENTNRMAFLFFHVTP